MNSILLHHLSELKSSVEISVASLFTKDDVLNILNFLEREVREFEFSEVKSKQEPCDDQIIELSPYLLPDFVNHIQSALATAIYELKNELVIDTDNCEYRFRGREIYITDINIDRHYIETIISIAMQTALKNYEYQKK